MAAASCCIVTVLRPVIYPSHCEYNTQELTFTHAHVNDSSYLLSSLGLVYLRGGGVCDMIRMNMNMDMNAYISYEYEYDCICNT